MEHIDLEMVAEAARATLLLMGWWDLGAEEGQGTREQSFALSSP